MEYSRLFHASSKNLSKNLYASVSPEELPDEWKPPDKMYPDLPKIKLIRENLSPITLEETLLARKSGQDFLRTSMDKSDLSRLLEFSCGISAGKIENGNSRRTYASAGGFFPIEIYVLIPRSGEVSAGLYHYDPGGHALEILSQREFSDTDIGKFFSFPFVKDASAVILMTAVFVRTQLKYGERGYRFILLEAGHIGQNIYLVSEALALKCCAIGGTRDTELEALLGVNGITESLVYAVAVGK